MCKSKLLRCAILGAALSLMVGCTSAEDPSPDKDLIAQLTITHAVDTVIEKAEDPVARAARIYDIAVSARQLLNNEQVTVPQLEQAVRDKLLTQALTPGDAKLIDSLVRAISLDLTRRVGSNHLDANQKLAVDKVLTWVIDAATLTKPLGSNFTVSSELKYADGQLKLVS